MGINSCFNSVEEELIFTRANMVVNMVMIGNDSERKPKELLRELEVFWKSYNSSYATHRITGERLIPSDYTQVEKLYTTTRAKIEERIL